MKKPSYKTLKKKLDTVFSRYIRLRDCFKSTGTPTYGVCVTCNKTVTYEESNAGHFMDRQHMATRWHEQNVNLQCVSCNKYNQGRQYEHGRYIAKEHEVFAYYQQFLFRNIKRISKESQRHE